MSQGEVPGKGQEAGADSTNSPSRGSQTRQKKQRRVEQKGKKAKKLQPRPRETRGWPTQMDHIFSITWVRGRFRE